MAFNPEEYQTLRDYLSVRRDCLKELDELFKASIFDDEAEREWAEHCKKATENLEKDTALVIHQVTIARDTSTTALDEAKYALFESQGREWLAREATAWKTLSSRGAEFARTFLAVQALNASIDEATASYIKKMKVFYEQGIKTADHFTEVLNLLEAALTNGWGDYLRTKFFPEEDKLNAVRDSLLLIINDRRSAKLLEKLISQIHTATSTYFKESSRDGTRHIRGLEKLRETPREVADLKPFNEHWARWRDESKGAQEDYMRNLKRFEETTEASRKGSFFEDTKFKALRLIGKEPLHFSRDFEKVQRDMERWLKDQE